MSELKYKVGDKVRIKSIDWYNENKDSNGNVVVLSKVSRFSWCENVRTVFTKDMSKFCGKVVTIEIVWTVNYSIVEGTCIDYFTDEMIEGLVEGETKPEFKIGDKITNGKVTLTILTLESDRYVVEDNFGKCGTLYFKSKDDWKIVEEEMKSEDELLNEYEELTDRAFKGGYEKCKSDIELNGFQLPDGYIFKDDNGNVINATKIVLEKKKKEYPKTYEECCEIIHSDPKFYVDTHLYSGALGVLYKLLICRDAYWVIAGEEMGLGKPWEPDWNDEKQDKYGFHNEVKYTIINSATFVFPTPEMRDAFKENFKKEIEICKELL